MLHTINIKLFFLSITAKIINVRLIIICMDQKFLEIENEYSKFYNTFFKKGVMPNFSTKMGTWSAAVSDYVYSFFKDFSLEKYKSFVDLGSGDGKVVLIASLFTKAQGIEFDEKLFEKSIELQHKLRLNSSFVNSDFLKHDLSKYDIIFINPDKGFIEIESKLINEMKGLLIVYNSIFKPRFLKLKKTYKYEETPISIYSK
jgi:histone methylation protein DOT1